MDKFNVEKEILDTSWIRKAFSTRGYIGNNQKKWIFDSSEWNDKSIGFVVSGIFRLSRIDVNGNEWIIGYSFFNDSVCDYPSFINRMGTTVNIQTSADCEVYLLSLNRLGLFSKSYKISQLIHT